MSIFCHFDAHCGWPETHNRILFFKYKCDSTVFNVVEEAQDLQGQEWHAENSFVIKVNGAKKRVCIILRWMTLMMSCVACLGFVPPTFWLHSEQSTFYPQRHLFGTGMNHFSESRSFKLFFKLVLTNAVSKSWR